MPPKRKRNRLSRKKAKSAAKPIRSKESRAPDAGVPFRKLVALMARLRGPAGCPWDREQTHATLRTYLIEEAYEVLEALDSGDDVKSAEELGDLLLQVLFHAQIAHEEGRFDITDVIREIYEKMVRRHPHVFGDTQAKDSAQVLRNWEVIKKEERHAKSGANHEDAAVSFLDGVPRGLPALLEGYQLTRKAARVGFDWHEVEGIFEKLTEETEELREVLGKGNNARIEGELGDLLFVAVNLARFLKVDPEIAMKKANAKFSRRFREMERMAGEKGTSFDKVPRGEMETLWEEAKVKERPEKS
jgi:MazG family protein